MENKINEILKQKYNNNLDSASDEQVYYALLELTKALMHDKPLNKTKKKVYYVSAEFLIGKLLSNNLINLGVYDEINDILKNHGKNLSVIEEIEPEPSLGNGGLGRLASCFLDSIATLGYSGDGIGLNYHFGLFKQQFKDHLQNEQPDKWIEDESWLVRQQNSYEVQFKDLTLKSTMYDIDIIGYDSGLNKLHLFDIDSVNENLVKDGINFDQKDIKENLTLFLYPDDSTKEGNLLRIYQQYFMVSNGAQYILEEVKKNNIDLRKLNEYITIQINDTHPTMIILELIRLLEKEGLSFDECVEVVSKTCAYTNHTILAEALEKWPMEYFEEVVPQLVPIIKKLDEIVRNKYNDERVYIIDSNNTVHMAHIDIHFTYSVNGVAEIHTDILKNSELKPFYDIYPEKFNNKTNGITFRRWLLHVNHELTDLITKLIGDGFKKDANELEKLLAYKDDETVINQILDIKHIKKVQLAEFMKNYQGIDINSDSIYDIQIKRMHEYKRQQMNALYIIYKYLDIKKGNKPKRPITCIFGAKAAPAYIIAKDIIHLLLTLSDVIANDPEVSPYLKVVFVENYNVSKAEKLIPACDISEQISLASKEASGTGNMKFMLNGAITLGTNDGANIEIKDLVGSENMYEFGVSSDEVIEHYAKADYCSRDIYESNALIKECVDFIVSDEMLKIGHEENLRRLYNELLNKDWFMTLIDLQEYIEVKNKAFEEYEDRMAWGKKMLVNIAKAGFFSSDRTIKEYNDDIWRLK